MFQFPQLINRFDLLHDNFFSLSHLVPYHHLSNLLFFTKENPTTKYFEIIFWSLKLLVSIHLTTQIEDEEVIHLFWNGVTNHLKVKGKVIHTSLKVFWDYACRISFRLGICHRPYSLYILQDRLIDNPDGLSSDDDDLDGSSQAWIHLEKNKRKTFKG